HVPPCGDPARRDGARCGRQRIERARGGSRASRAAAGRARLGRSRAIDGRGIVRRHERRSEAMDFEPGPKVRELQARLSTFMGAQVYPNEARYYAELDAASDRWQPARVVEELKPLAKDAGLWNLFLPDSNRGAGLTNLEYAPLCE